MATAPGDTATDPVADFARRAHTRLDDLHTTASRPVWAMTSEELRETLGGLAMVEAQVAALRLEVLAEADQARTIGHALDALPATGPDAVTPEQQASAEAFLVDHATRHDARDLAVLGRRLHEVIAPEQADAHEGRALEAEERRAAARMSFEMRKDPDGTCHGRFRIPKLHGAMLTQALQALMSPARPSPVEPVETTPTPPHAQRPYTTRRGEAFAELVERLGARDLPSAGGGDATVVVTMTLDQLLGGASQVLDHGSSHRLFTKAQRLALAQQQGGCTAELCDAPPAMCHAHHDRPWSADGPTDLSNGRLLCAHHHRRIRDPAYEARRRPDGTVALHRRT